MATEVLAVPSLSPVDTDKPSKSDTVCEICKDSASKYRCPRCHCRTCSLPCVRRHKELQGCDGVRDKTAYVPMNSFNENHLLSDYRLLEEIARRCDTNERFLKTKPSFKTRGMQVQIYNAQNMGIDLRLLPLTFSGRKGNSTYFYKNTNSFVWHTHWDFFPSGESCYKKSVPDSNSLEEALKLCGTNAMEEKYLYPENVCIYMQRRDMPANQTKYHKLNPNLSIRDNLKGKTVIEYPRFIVALRNEAEKFETNCYDGPPPVNERLKTMKRYSGEEDVDEPPPKIPASIKLIKENLLVCNVAEKAKPQKFTGEVKKAEESPQEPQTKRLLPSAESILKDCFIKNVLSDDAEDPESFP